MDDTIVDHRTGEITFPFFLRVLPPMPRKFFDFRSTSNYNFSDYCKKTYGLNDDEVVYLWSRYKDLFSDEVFGRNSINESDDKKKKFLDKVVDFIVKDTITFDGEQWVRYPWDPEATLKFNSRTDLKFTYDDFRNYVIETYGLTLMDEVEYVWEELRRKLDDKLLTGDMITESDDKKQVYLNKIVDWLVRDTEVGGVGGYWFNPPYYYPGSSAGRTGFRSVYEHTFGLSTNNTYSGLDSQLIYFDHYCKNNYGLTGEETKIVWYDYMKKLKESYDWGF